MLQAHGLPGLSGTLTILCTLWALWALNSSELSGLSELSELLTVDRGVGNMTDLSYDEAAHLSRRAGFGSPPGEIDNLVSMGREQAVDFLINFGQVDNTQLENLIAQSFDFSNPSNFSKFNRAELERWWFTRMVYTARPFEEKMTLFWHNHFATAASKVPDLLMYLQNQTLRANSLARFDDLLL